MSDTIGVVDVTYIPSTGTVDPVTVFWQNFSPGKGSVTITCYGDAWTAYFGAMGGSTIQKFVVESASVEYLANKLTPNHVRLNQTQTKRQDEYLGRILRVIKEYAMKGMAA